MTESGLITCERCKNEDSGRGIPRTMYVHLQNGDIVPVPEVTQMEVTDQSLVLQREASAPVAFPRSDVYYACCEHDMAPPQF